MKILTLGAGFVAKHLLYDIILDRINPDHNSIGAMINVYKPDVLINCIGYGGSKNIDDCETNKNKTFITNTIIPSILASTCEARGIRLIHISSGCIFNGASPNQYYPPASSNRDQYIPPTDLGWNEKDIANPISLYSRSKLAAELILQSYSNTTILRVRMPISTTHHPRNLISKLISYKKVIEIENSITPLFDLTRAIQFVIDKGLTGTYHITNPKPIKHSALLDEYCKYNTNHKYEKISAGELDRMVLAKRSNCILNSEKIIHKGFEFQPIDDVIKKYIEGYVKGK